MIKMTRFLTKLLCAAFIVLGLVSGASADLVIDAYNYPVVMPPDPASYSWGWAGSGPANLNAGDIAAIVGSTGDLFSELYKQDVGVASATGPFASSYTTTFSNTPADPSGASIVYVDGKPSISSDPVYLFVKDGKHDPGWYLFNLTVLGWTGTETIVLTNFWPDGGAISHVAMYGEVPIPGAVWLLGSGLIGLVGVRRRLQK